MAFINELSKLNELDLPFKEILLLFLTSLSTYLVWKVQYQKDKIKDIENQLSEKKYKLYSELIYVIFDVINNLKSGSDEIDEAIKVRFLNAKRDMFLYAPDKVFKAFTNWTLELNKPNGARNHFKYYYKMIKLIRVDMGQSSTKIELDDFMLFLMQNEEEYSKFKKQQNW